MNVDIAVVAQPGARREGVLGMRGEALRIAVTAPPEKGKANEAIRAVLAEALGCRLSQVALISGATSRQKRFRIEGFSHDELRQRLAPWIPEVEESGISRRDAEARGGAEKR